VNDFLYFDNTYLYLCHACVQRPDDYETLPDDAAVNSDSVQQPTSCVDDQGHSDVIGDQRNGYEGLDAAGLAEFQSRSQMPNEYNQLK